MCPIALCSHMMEKECKPYFGPVVEGEQFAIKCPFFEHLQSKVTIITAEIRQKHMTMYK